MKTIKYVFLTILIFCICSLNPKAFKTQTDYVYGVKDYMTFKQKVSGIQSKSIFNSLFSGVEIKDGTFDIHSLCKYHYKTSCLCTDDATEKLIDLDPLDQDSCFCFDYPIYKYSNYATFYADLAGDFSVFVNSSNNTSDLTGDLVTGSYDYADSDYFFNTESSKKNELFGLESITSNKSTIEKYINESGLSDFINYGWCPSNMVVNPGADNDDSFSHKGDILFGKFGLTGNIYKNLFYQHYKSVGSLSKSEARNIMEKYPINLYNHFNDVFELDNQSSNAFSKSDKEYIDNVIYDLTNLNTYNDTDLVFCDFAAAGNNTYDNLYKALDFASYVDRSFGSAGEYTTHKSLKKLLEVNGYYKLADAIIDNLGTNSKCYEKYGSIENSSKYEALYDKAKAFQNSSNVNPNNNTINTCNDLLGNPDNPDDVAYYVQVALNFVKILGPVLIIALSVYDYVRAIPSGDKEILNKVNKKTVVRVCAGIAIFFAPILVEALFKLLGLYSGNDCGIG